MLSYVIQYDYLEPYTKKLLVLERKLIEKFYIELFARKKYISEYGSILYGLTGTFQMLIQMLQVVVFPFFTQLEKIREL